MSSATPSPTSPRSSAAPRPPAVNSPPPPAAASVPQTPSSPAVGRADIVRNFKQAWESKDIRALLDLLDPDATAIADGGGLVGTVLRPVEGAEQILRLFLAFGARTADLTIVERMVNGQPGLVALQDGVVVTVYAFDVTGDRITHIWAVRNPEKLSHWRAGPAGLG